MIFKRQVDDFAIAAPDAQTADILLDMLDDKLRIPIKRQGFLDMYNGIDVYKTRDFKEGPLPIVHSNKQDLLMTDDRLEFDTNILHAYADSDWDTCPKIRRSFGGACLRLAGGMITYKCKFQPTIAGSSTEDKFMVAYDTRKMILYVRGILWDLGIPQEAATVMHEDNDACTAMGNAQKPNPCTRHMDITYFLLCNWVERDLMHLEGVDTMLNMADMFNKSLP